MANIMKAVQFMIDTANDNTHGYDQSHRNGPDYDCSSLVGTALHESGFNVSPYSWTGNLESQLRKEGFVECKEPWLGGDIHLNTQNHVAMSINNTQIVEATINEKGTISGGKTGDQTGNEIRVTNYYEYNGGWSVHLRCKSVNADTNPNKSIDTIAREVIAGKWGNGETRKSKLIAEGYEYNVVQAKVNAILSGTVLKSNGEIAREVIAGKWGNGETRKNKLITEGYDYYVIQKLVNQMLA